MKYKQGMRFCPPSPRLVRMAPNSDTTISLDAVLDALSDPQRRRLYRQIDAAPGIVCSALLPDVPRSTVSVQLRRLREAGLISQERQGQLIANRIREDGAWAQYPALLRELLNAEQADDRQAPRG